MKIVLFGYGKMGQLVEKFADKKKHEITLIIDENNRNQITADELRGKGDIAIDFSTPAGALDNIKLCFEANMPLVMGTTGWYDHLDEVKEECLRTGNSFLFGSNFSIGVNILFHINKVLAKMMKPYKQYDVQVEEIHHTEKHDSPSGTAITLAEGILHNSEEKSDWVNYIVDEEEPVVPKADELLIESLRIEDVRGTHTVLYSSEVDQIELKHTAHTRDGFALGAILAAEWLIDKKGFYEVTDIFDFNN